MNEADDAFDAITLVMVLAIFTPIMVYLAIPFFKGNVGGFGIQIEKAALETKSEVVAVERKVYTQDGMLMLAVADRHTPQPAKIRLSTSGTAALFTLNDVFFEDRNTYLLAARAAMPTDMQINYPVLFSGPRIIPTSPQSGMRFWDIQPHGG